MAKNNSKTKIYETDWIRGTTQIIEVKHFWAIKDDKVGMISAD